MTHLRDLVGCKVVLLIPRLSYTSILGNTEGNQLSGTKPQLDLNTVLYRVRPQNNWHIALQRLVSQGAGVPGRCCALCRSRYFIILIKLSLCRRQTIKETLTIIYKGRCTPWNIVGRDMLANAFIIYCNAWNSCGRKELYKSSFCSTCTPLLP